MTRIDVLFDKHDLKTLEAAVERKRRQEQRRLDGLMSKKRALESELKDVNRSLKSALAEAKRAQGGKVKRRPNARRLNDISLADALEKVMRGRKTPIHYKKLTEAVVRRGLYRTRSKNLLSTVAVTLKRDRRFKKVEPGYYKLR
jgi:hypothetical protein